MSDYRCYLLDRLGAIRLVEPITGTDDDAALQLARDLVADRPNFVGFELWQKRRRVFVEIRRRDLVD